MSALMPLTLVLLLPQGIVVDSDGNDNGPRVLISSDVLRPLLMPFLRCLLEEYCLTPR